MVYVGAMETEEACLAWKEEYALAFPVVPDLDGALFRALTNGWVPWSVLIGPDGKVVFSENDFDEAGFAAAIQRMYEPASTGTGEKQITMRRAAKPVGRTVVLGGGSGGLVAARELKRRVPAGHHVVLVDRSPDHLFQASLLWHMVGERQPEDFRRPLQRLERKGIEFRRAEIEGLDLDAKTVSTSAGEVAYDSLVVALGAQLTPEAVPGFDEMALNLYTPEGCARIHSALDQFEGGRVGVLVTSLPFKCPAAPYEAAFLAEAFLRRKGIRRNVEIHLFTPEHTPMPVAPASLGTAISEMLAARGIQYHPLFMFDHLRPATRELVAADGSSEQVDLLIAVPPHQAPDVIRSSPLLGVTGFVHADARTLQSDFEDIFAIGDVAAVRLPNDKMLPKAGVFAHAEAKVVAEQIAASLDGRTTMSAFEGKGYCWVELGDGRAAFAGGDFYAEPEPQLTIRRPGRPLHWGKVAFEKWWLHHWL